MGEILCGKCKSADVRRSHRASPLEHIYALAGYYPYRCHGCQHRFYLPRKSDGTTPPSERRIERIKLDKKRTLRLIVLFLLSLVIFLLFAWKFILVEPAQQTGYTIEPESQAHEGIKSTALSTSIRGSFALTPIYSPPKRTRPALPASAEIENNPDIPRPPRQSRNKGTE